MSGRALSGATARPKTLSREMKTTPRVISASAIRVKTMTAFGPKRSSALPPSQEKVAPVIVPRMPNSPICRIYQFSTPAS